MRNGGDVHRRLLHVAILAALLPAEAWAAKPGGVTLAPAVVGEAPVTAESVDAAVATAVSESVTLTPAPQSPACAESACALALAEDAEVSHLITASVEKTGPDHRVEMTLWSGGDAIAEVHDTCEICGATELLEVVAGAARAIGTKADQLTRPGTLALSVQPEGVLVSIDGEAYEGQASGDLDAISLLPGTHTIELSLEGYETRSSEVRIVAGVREQLQVTLEPVVVEPPPADEPPDRDAGRGLRAAGYAGLGLGLAALGSGVALIVMEERPLANRCSGENVDSDGDCKYRYATLESGLAFAIGGGVVLASAIAMIVVGHKRKKQSNIRVSASPTGLFVSGRF